MEQTKNIPLVSVIIPCYNQAIYLPDTLNSLLIQTYQYWEAIVVNDGSPDDTENIALQYVGKDSRIRYLSKENSGVSATRNYGIQHARGEFILPLDADDLFAPTYIEKAVDAFLKHPESTMIYCQWQFFGTQTTCNPIHYTNYKELLISNSIFCSAMYRKTDWSHIEGYCPNMTLGMEDWEFNIRML